MKKIINGKEARIELKRGLDMTADAVKVTMGAKGRPVAIDRPYTTPLVTKDGVTVAKEIRFEDPVLNMGANILIEAASLTNSKVGDGTTTCSVLTQAIVEKGIEMSDDTSFYEVKAGMEYAMEEVLNHLKENSISIKDDEESIEAIPAISANNDKQIGKLIAETFQEVGEHGFISVEDSKTYKTYKEVSKGLKIKMSPESNFFFEDTVKKTSDIKDSKVLLYIGRIETESEIVPAITLAAQENKHLLVVCNEMNPLLMTRIISTRNNGQAKITVVQSPEFGIFRQEAMEDIALVSGARLFLQEKDDDISKVTKEELGAVDKILIDEENTSFINSGHEKKIEEVIEHLLTAKEQTEDEQEKENLKQRIARLKGGVARIYVGGHSPMEMQEKKDRIIDAVNALSVAYKDGVVIGGGVALLKASNHLKSPKNSSFSFKTGAEIIKEAIKAPITQILKNAGKKEEDIKLIIKKVNSTGKGYNVVTDKFVDMKKEGILDPLGVTQSALRNAVSVSTVFLSTESILLDVTNWQTKDIQFADGI